MAKSTINKIEAVINKVFGVEDFEFLYMNNHKEIGGKLYVWNMVVKCDFGEFTIEKSQKEPITEEQMCKEMIELIKMAG